MKKVIALLLIPIALFSLASCTAQSRPNYDMLSTRLEKINENYAFDYFDMFIYDNAYHVYFSLCSEDDILLSMHTDSSGNIDDLTITARAENFKTESEKQKFADFSSAVIDSYAELSANEAAELENTLSFNKPERYFADLYEKYSSLRYHFIFSSNTEFICLYCEYYEMMENPTRGN